LLPLILPLAEPEDAPFLKTMSCCGMPVSAHIGVAPIANTHVSKHTDNTFIIDFSLVKSWEIH
jgi:hypothetical protein